MIRNSITGEFHQVYAHDMHSSIFRDIQILDALKALKGIADYVNIRGDLPCEYRDDLRKILSAVHPGAGGKKMRKADAEIASKKYDMTEESYGLFLSDIVKSTGPSPTAVLPGSRQRCSLKILTWNLKRGISMRV